MLIKDIAQAIGGRYEGDGSFEIDRIVHPERAQAGADLAVALSAHAAAALPGTKARAAVISEASPVALGSFAAVIVIRETRIAFAKLTALFDPGPPHEKGIHSTAIIAADAVIGEGVSIGACAVIGPRCRIGAGTTILPHVTIGAGSSVGANGLVHPGVRIGHGCKIGDRTVIHANAVIGADGFSFAPDLTSEDAYAPGVKVTRVHSLGNVEIGDDVEIGAGTTIDRATLESTRIGNGTKIDNHVHIGHNVTIGESCILCGMVGISGSVVIGNRVRFGGGAGVGDHRRIGDNALVGAGSGVASDVAPGTFVSGYPAIPHQQSAEQWHYLRRQRRLHDKVAAMAARLDALEQANKK